MEAIENTNETTTKTFGARNRPVILIEGMPCGARLVPHKTDPELLVLKAPEGYTTALLEGLGIEPKAQLASGEGRGGFHAVAVAKAEFLAALPNFLDMVLGANEATKDAPVVECEPDIEDPSDDLIDSLN